MVGLKRNRKGMVAMMDAMIFLFLISLVATWLFAFSGIADTEEPMAKEITDDFFSMEVRTCDLMYLDDTKILPIGTLIAANMNTGEMERTEEFVSKVINDMVPDCYGYELILEYGGHSLSICRQSYRPMSSEYITDHEIDGADPLKSILRVY